jgi:hypothetical protein
MNTKPSHVNNSLHLELHFEGMQDFGEDEGQVTNEASHLLERENCKHTKGMKAIILQARP